MTGAAAPSPPIVVGRVRKPHGLKGELAVYPLTDDPDGIFASGKTLLVLDLEGRTVGTLTVQSARIYHRECLVKVKGLETRDAVEQFRERFLAVAAEELRGPDEGEVYLREIIGWAVRSTTDEPLGLVTDVYELPQGPAIEVQGPKREFLLPLEGGYVKEMDRTAKRLVVDVPRGLLD